MAEKQLTTKIQLRNDISSNWAGSNVKLLNGELAIDLDSNTIRIGRGNKTWSELSADGRLQLSATDVLGLEDYIKGEIQDTNTVYALSSIETDDGKYAALVSADGTATEKVWSEVTRVKSVVTSADIDGLDENFLKVTQLNTELTADNKIATIADIAGLSGCIHFRGAFTNPDDSEKSDISAMYDAYKPLAKGDVAINTSNGKEFLAIVDVDTEDKVTEANIVTLGDESTYETKADALLKLAEAKEYTDDEIAKLSAVDTAIDGQFVTAVSEADGKITVTRAALTSADIPELEYDALGAADTVKTELLGTEADLSSDATVYGVQKRVDEVSAELDSKIGEVDDKAEEVSAALSDYLKTDDYAISAVAISSTTAATADLVPVDKKVTLGTMAQVDKDAYTADFNEALNQVVTVLSGPDTAPIASSLSVVKVDNEWYQRHIGTGAALSGNTLYIIDDDYVSMYGRQVKDVDEPTDDTDAATKKYVDDEIATATDPDTLSVNVKNLVQTEGDVLVLFGGTATA